jgi:histidinol-phosphate aminotransferase
VWRDERDFSVRADAIVEAAREADLVMLTSPNNPTGDLLDPALVRRLLDETDALVMLDEAYVDFAPASASLVSWVVRNPKLMILRTLSKAFALAGLRCGYLVADPAIINVLAAIRQIYSEDVVAQAVANRAVALREELVPVIDDIVAERTRLSQALAKIPDVQQWPSSANFMLIRLPHAGEVRARLRDEHSILVRDFSYAKGLADCLRITVGTADENDELIAALRAIVEGE